MQAGSSAPDAGAPGPFSRKSVQTAANSSMDSDPEALEHGQRTGTVNIPVSYNRMLASKTSEPLEDDYSPRSPNSLPTTSHRCLAGRLPGCSR